MDPLVYQQDQNNGSGSSATRASLKSVLRAVYGLTLLRNVVCESTGQAFLHLLEILVAIEPQPEAVASAYSRVFNELAIAANTETVPQLADAWQSYLVTRLLENRNVWTIQVEQNGIERISPTVRAQARRDLRVLQSLYQLDAQTLWRAVQEVMVLSWTELADAWVPWLDLAPQRLLSVLNVRAEIMAQLAASDSWETMTEPLEGYWARHGTGKYTRYYALRWSVAKKQLAGIVHPDTVRLDNLIGQERQQAQLITNIERFLAGLPAQDMLLYGPPGTGKSSTIKALANTYAEQGLRLVEVSKEDVGDLQLVVASLRALAPHYLLFIDDLSFEEHETGYKALKVILEGTAEVRPANVLICTTSNRLNLIRESFTDRGRPTEDVNWRDTMDEKQSLAHRFALRVTFMSPDQRQYLHIVEKLAEQRKLDIAAEVLQQRALQWERQHSGRSGRLARQFIDELVDDIQ